MPVRIWWLSTKLPLGLLTVSRSPLTRSITLCPRFTRQSPSVGVPLPDLSQRPARLTAGLISFSFDSLAAS
jgi:hypothetical protein